MTQKSQSAEDLSPHKGVQTVMTAQLALRQFLLLFAAATMLLLMAFFIKYYNAEQASFLYLWQNQVNVDLRIIAIPVLIVIFYGYVLLNGILFALGPSERSFSFFFFSMVVALLVLNYDQSVLDWFVQYFAQAQLRPQNTVSAFKILFAGLFFLVIITMHYNILSDDFARRMLRRGVPTDEVAQVRPGMFKVLVPTVLTAGALAFGLALVGELGALIFQQHGLFLSKLQLVLLAALIVPMAYLIRGILREMRRTSAE